MVILGVIRDGLLNLRISEIFFWVVLLPSFIIQNFICIQREYIIADYERIVCDQSQVVSLE